MAKRRKKFRPGGQKGKLHRELGVPEGEKIPQSTLQHAARKSNPNHEERDDAIRAETMEHWKKPAHPGRRAGLINR